MTIWKKVGVLACGVGLATLASGCGRQTGEEQAERAADPTEAPAVEAPEKAATTDGPTGSDYHSTALRARRRGTDRLEDMGQERSEQVEAEKTF